MITSCFKFNPDFSANAAFRGKERTQCLYKHMEISDKWTETAQYIY